MADVELPAEGQRLPALKLVPKKDQIPIMKDVNKVLAWSKITSIEQMLNSQRKRKNLP